MNQVGQRSSNFSTSCRSLQAALVSRLLETTFQSQTSRVPGSQPRERFRWEGTTQSENPPCPWAATSLGRPRTRPGDLAGLTARLASGLHQEVPREQERSIWGLTEIPASLLGPPARPVRAPWKSSESM